MEYYSVYELAKQIGVSSTTIYNKLKNREVYKVIKPYIKVVKGNKSISVEGIEILKNYIHKDTSKKNNNQNNTSEAKKPLNASTSDMFATLQTNLITSLQSSVESLKIQLETKDKQIESLIKSLDTAQKLNENNQILLRENQQKVLMLEERKSKNIFQKIFSFSKCI